MPGQGGRRGGERCCRDLRECVAVQLRVRGVHQRGCDAHGVVGRHGQQQTVEERVDVGAEQKAVGDPLVCPPK